MSKNNKTTEVTLYTEEDLNNMFNDLVTKANSNDMSLDEIRDLYINIINHINNHVFIIDYLKQLSKKLSSKCQNHNINIINNDNDDDNDDFNNNNFNNEIYIKSIKNKSNTK